MSVKAKMQLNAIKPELDDDNHKNTLFADTKDDVTSKPFLSYPKIIYSSRTHSQLSQVVKELKMTQYK
jgi:hypothetical protein